ncbi:hypothetical protein GCM10022199_26170 [Marihabitans asiaticum]|uniref:VapB protein of antitoxin of type II toxin-antitoxin system n=1 Tax=Marihabitans asiaticum TaxID=415218 RepID=A0A560WGJ1_9MICO|nr:type II toxin-antitoxin system VapB family antitoxin [Marihabitans asiaticum]TWD16801.1 hypothetical protein FB557_0338 [Marihabitans asiaticum]
MRTTVTIDDGLLAEAKILAAREHRTIGSVLEESLQDLLDRRAVRGPVPAGLPTFTPERPGLRDGVDLEDRDTMDQLLEGEGGARALP